MVLGTATAGENRDWSRAFNRFLNLFDSPYLRAVEDLSVHGALKSEVERRCHEFQQLREEALGHRATANTGVASSELKTAVKERFIPHVTAVRGLVKEVQSVSRFQDRPIWHHLKAWCDDMTINLAQIGIVEGSEAKPQVVPFEPTLNLEEKLSGEAETPREAEPYLEEAAHIRAFVDRERRAQGEGFFTRLTHWVDGSLGAKTPEKGVPPDADFNLPYEEVLKIGYVDLKSFRDLRHSLGALIDCFTDLLKSKQVKALPVIRVGGCITEGGRVTRRLLFGHLLKNLTLVEEALSVIHRDTLWEECQTVFFNPLVQYMQEMHTAGERILGSGHGMPEPAKKYAGLCVAQLRRLSESIHRAEAGVA